ncbi:MAG TPA: integrase arm-type DNA-binding domain-containing protein, partial [Roseomonas sp.]
MGEQRFRLTDQTVKGIRVPPAKSDVVVADSDIPGFAVRVLKSGKRIFQLRYRTDKTTVRKLVLGEFGTEVTTAEARQMAEAARGLIRQGRDPWRERQEAAAATEAAKKRSAFTVEKLIENWRDLHLRPKRSADYAKNSDSLLRAAVAKLLPRPAPSVTKADIVAAIDALASGQARGANGKARGGHIAANRAIAAGSAAWNFAIKRGELPEPNPWNIPKPGDETARERTLSDVELAAVWWAADGLGARWAAIVRLLALTGARLREVAEMEWRELDLDSGDWTLDRTRAKNRLTSIVPLPPAAIEILRALPRADGAQFVFETKGRKGEPAAPSAFSKPKAALDKLLGKQVAPWRFHDLRRTAETGFQRL